MIKIGDAFMNKKVKLLIIGTILVAIIGISSSLALWVIDKKQTSFNAIKTGCIDLSFSNGSGTLSLENTLPITDADGLNLTGYTFTVRNNCNGEIAYLLNLDLFNVSEGTNLTTDEIKVAVDNKVPRRLSLYEDTTVGDADAYGAKTLYAGKLGAKESDTHTIKMWVDESSIKENAYFSNRLFTMANPNLTVPEVANDDCFIMDGNGKILMYKTAYCPSKVIIPSTIQNQTVTGVAEGAFRDANVVTIYNSSEQKVDFVILDETNYDTLESIINGIVNLDVQNNGGVEHGLVPNYAIYKSSEYSNWSSFNPGLLNNQYQDEKIDGSLYNVSNSHRLNIPLDLDANDYYNALNSSQNGFIAYTFDTNYNCSSCYYSGNGPTNNLIAHYLESIDFSRCTSLQSLDQYAIAYNGSLTTVEIPNNSGFTFENSCLTYNNINRALIPTGASAIKTSAYNHNNISYVELYSTNSLALYPSAFENNNVSNLVVNSNIDVSNVVGYTLPFANNPLISTGIVIGLNSNNTAADFINVN